MARNHSRWYDALADALKNEENTVMQLATVEPPRTPRVRSIVHRGFLAARAHPTLPLLFSTTDIRTPKVAQLRGAHRAAELVYRAPHAQAQFRIQGRVSVVPAPGFGGAYLGVPRTRRASDGGGQGDGKVGDDGGDGDEVGVVYAALEAEGFDWERARVAAFDEMGARLRASWGRPATPGTPLAEAGGQAAVEGWPAALPALGGAESEAEARAVAEALGNFALLVVEPFEVDYTELGVSPERRTKYVREGAWSVEFKETAVVP